VNLKLPSRPLTSTASGTVWHWQPEPLASEPELECPSHGSESPGRRGGPAASPSHRDGPSHSGSGWAWLAAVWHSHWQVVSGLQVGSARADQLERHRDGDGHLGCDGHSGCDGHWPGPPGPAARAAARLRLTVCHWPGHLDWRQFLAVPVPVPVTSSPTRRVNVGLGVTVTWTGPSSSHGLPLALTVSADSESELPGPANSQPPEAQACTPRRATGTTSLSGTVSPSRASDCRPEQGQCHCQCQRDSDIETTRTRQTRTSTRTALNPSRSHRRARPGRGHGHGDATVLPATARIAVTSACATPARSSPCRCHLHSDTVTSVTGTNWHAANLMSHAAARARTRNCGRRWQPKPERLRQCQRPG
jgi:hypothetical protein